MTEIRWKTYALGIDVSGIQKVVDYERLSQGLDFYIVRLGKGQWTYKNIVDPSVAVDTYFAKHVQGAWDTHKVCGAYWVFDPTVDQDVQNPIKDRQIASIMYGLKNKVGKSVHFLVLDVEIYLNGYGQVIPDTIISGKFANMIRALHNIYPDLKIGIYTGKWFIDDHCPSLKNAIDQLYREPWFFTWIAQYPWDKDWSGATTEFINNLGELREKFAPEWEEGKSFPWLCNGESTIWQSSGDRYKMEGHYGEIAGAYSVMDIDWFRGTVDKMKEWCGYSEHETIEVPVVPVEEPELCIRMTNAKAMNIRSGPGTTYPIVGVLLAKSVIDVRKLDQNWVQIDAAYVCKQLNGQTFLKQID